MTEDIEREIQSWIAVRSFAVEDANPQAPIIDANELAEFVTEVFKKLEGCVVVPKDQIETWWQDAEEPENFETEAQNIHSIADDIDDGDIIEFHEHHTIHLPSSTLFGVWTYKEGKRVFITGTKAEVIEAARGGNE